MPYGKKSTDEKARSGCWTQVDDCHVFDVEQRHLSHPQMLLEACQGRSWSAPLEVPLLQSQSTDMDESFAALSLDDREQALERVAMFLGKLTSSNPDSRTMP